VVGVGESGDESRLLEDIFSPLEGAMPTIDDGKTSEGWGGGGEENIVLE